MYFSDFGNQRYSIGVIDTGCICRVMHHLDCPGDYCNGWLGMGDDKMSSIQMGLHGDKFLRHGACLVLLSPLEMGGLWRSPAAHLVKILSSPPHPPTTHTHTHTPGFIAIPWLLLPSGLIQYKERCCLTSIGIPIVEIRRSHDRLMSTMGFPIPVRWHLYIESGPWNLCFAL